MNLLRFCTLSALSRNAVIARMRMSSAEPGSVRKISDVARPAWTCWFKMARPRVEAPLEPSPAGVFDVGAAGPRRGVSEARLEPPETPWGRLVRCLQ